MKKSTVMPIDHPGSFIAEELEERGWLQADLAYILGMDAGQLNKLISGKADINPDIAVALGEAFDMPPDFFMNLQKLYDLNRAKKADPGVRARASWLSAFPVREMIKRGWIEDAEPALLDLQMLRFFEKNRVQDIPFVGTASLMPYAARKVGYEHMTALQYVWLTRVRKIAEQMTVPLYSEATLRANLPIIRSLMMEKEDLGLIPNILEKCGVRYVLVEALPGSKIDGVCVWLEGQPVIGMTLRLDRIDNFCFVLRHEIEHVLNQDGMTKSFAPVDEFDNEDSDAPDYERAADAAAAEFCIPQSLLESFILRKSPFISEKDVLIFAARVEINPAVVVGQIQKRTKKWTFLRKYQTSSRENVLDWPFKDGWGFHIPTGL